MSTTSLARRTSRSSIERTIGLTGIAGMVVLFVPLIVTSPNEPDLDTSTAKAAHFLSTLDAAWIWPVSALGSIGMIGVLWFMVGLALLLRRDEGEVPVRSTAAMLSAVIVAGFAVLDTGYQAGAHRAAELSDAQLAYAYDQTQIGFTHIWLPMGSFAFACGWLMISTGMLPRWLGRWGMVTGIALAFTQMVWQSGIIWLPYGSFWLWLLTTSVLLVRWQTGGAVDTATA